MLIQNEGTITGTQVSYAKVCLRKLWLYTNGIVMENFSERVEEGRVLHIQSYPRETKEVQVPGSGVTLDFCEKDGTVHEVKLSPSLEEAHIIQLAYYLKLFRKHNQDVIRGIIHYPKLKKTQEVILTEELEKELDITIEQVRMITQQQIIPAEFPPIKLCKKCAYYEFCFS